MTAKSNKRWTLLVFQGNSATASLLVPRDSKQHQCRTKSGGGTKTSKALQFTTPAWVGHHLLSCDLFPYCTSSQQVSLLVFFLFPSFLFLPPTFFLFYKEEFDAYKSSNTQHLSPGGLLFMRQHLRGARWDPLSAIDRRCCRW